MLPRGLRRRSSKISFPNAATFGDATPVGGSDPPAVDGGSLASTTEIPTATTRLLPGVRIVLHSALFKAPTTLGVRQRFCPYPQITSSDRPAPHHGQPLDSLVRRADGTPHLTVVGGKVRVLYYEEEAVPARIAPVPPEPAP